MNQVSWRRILQRAEDNLPAEGEIRSSGAYAPAPQMRDMPTPATSVRDASARSFETDLRFALEKAAAQSYEPPAPPLPVPAPARPQQFVRQQAPRLQQPVRQQQYQHPQPQQQLVARPQPPQYAAHPHPQAAARSGEFGQRNMLVPAATPARYARRRPQAEPRRGGMRNFLVISLSTAVFAFAVNQISVQWRSVNGGGINARMADSTASHPNYTGTVEAGVMPSTMTFQTVAPEETAPSAQRPVNAVATLPTPDEIREAVRALKEENAQSMAEIEGVSKQADSRAVSLTQTEEQVLMRRATSLLEAKDVAGARQVLEYLAGRNSAVGAYSLAQTYDAKFLRGMGVASVSPDPALAQKWYKQAANLGSGEAKTYLKTQRN